MRDRAPCDQLVVGLDAECRNNGFDNRSAGLLLLNDRHGPVQGNWTWHGKRHHAPNLHRQPVRSSIAVAAGVAVTARARIPIAAGIAVAFRPSARGRATSSATAGSIAAAVAATVFR